MKFATRVFLLAFGLCATGCAAAEASAATRPNVLFICVDDLKPLLGCYGDRVVKSPNIDRLASRGMVFERAYCNQAVCAPSRNALMTGMRSTTLGIYDLATNFRESVPDAVTLPQLFKQNGYRTEAMGKIFHVGHGNHEDPASWSIPHWHAQVVAYAKSRGLTNELTREEALFGNVTGRNIADMPKGAPYEDLDVPDDTYPDGQVADEAIRRLQSAKKKTDEPFFIAVGFVKPHLPFCAPKKYWDLYDRAAFKPAARQTPPEGAPAYAPQFGGELRQYSGIPEQGALEADLQRTLIHGYHAAVSYMDAQLGRVLDELDRLDLGRNTIIVLWGDHGWHLGDHGIWCKHTNYEQAAHIPLIVVAPSVGRPSTRTTALVETVDIYPTLCELAGISTDKISQKLDGRSFVSTLSKSAAPTKEAIFHSFPRRPQGKGPIIGRAVRTARYRLVEWKKPGASSDSADLELYDYETDPDETRNLAATQTETVSKLRAILDAQAEAKPQIQAAAQKRKTAR
jgi:iduronate 2-sulfatase